MVVILTAPSYEDVIVNPQFRRIPIDNRSPQPSSLLTSKQMECSSSHDDDVSQMS